LNPFSTTIRQILIVSFFPQQKHFSVDNYFVCVVQW
jgi:hypothetical protein